MRIRAYGPGASIVDGLAPGMPATLRRAVLERCSARGIATGDVVPASSSLVVTHPEGRGSAVREILEALLSEPAGSWSGTTPGVEREIPVRYDGEDLGAVAAACGLSVDELVSMHTGCTFTVEFHGFSPGFAYLHGLPAPLHLARRSSPRPRVPAGSVAIAGRHCAVYPQETPGGWHLLGTTRVRMWDQRRDPPALLQPGDRVRFVRIEDR